MVRRHETRQGIKRPGRIDAATQFAGQGVRQQPVRGDVALVGVGQNGIAHRIGEPRRVDLAMQPLGRERISTGLETGQDVEDQQGDHALPVRRTFVHLVAAEAGFDRRYVGALGLGEILEGVQPAEPLQKVDHVGRHRALVEGVGALAADGFQRIRERRLVMHRPGRGCPAVLKEHARRLGIAAQQFLLRCPVASDARAHGIAMPGKTYGGFQHVPERSRAIIPQQPAPGFDRAGHRYRMRRLARDLTEAVIPVPRRGRGRGRTTRAIVGHDFVGPVRREQGETIAADPCRAGFHDALHRAGRNGGVERVPAILQHVDRGERRRGMRRRRHPGPGHDQGAPRRLEIPHMVHPVHCVSMFILPRRAAAPARAHGPAVAGTSLHQSAMKAAITSVVFLTLERSAHSSNPCRPAPSGP